MRSRCPHPSGGCGVLILVSSVRRLLLVAAVLAAALLTAGPATAASLSAVQAKLTREMRAAGPSAGAVVRDLDSGRTIFALRADNQRVPASVEKLFVSAATLMRDGPEGRIATRAVAEAAPTDGVVAGPLYLVGGGDPTLSAARITELAAAVKAAGVTTVQGGVLGDDSAFDHRIGSPDSDFRYDRELGGLLTGLAVNRGWDSKGLQDVPAASAARRFARALKLAGVAVSGDVEAGTAPVSAVDVAQIQSAPLSAIVAAMNGPSDNYLAEMLLKRLGAAHGAGGTTAAGAAAAAAALDDIGVRPRIVDGSGLSRSDRTTPRQVVRLLQRVANMEFAQPFTASLPVAGRERHAAAPDAGHGRGGQLPRQDRDAALHEQPRRLLHDRRRRRRRVRTAHERRERRLRARDPGPDRDGAGRLGRHRRRPGRGAAERARAGGPGDRGRRRGGSAP